MSTKVVSPLCKSRFASLEFSVVFVFECNIFKCFWSVLSPGFLHSRRVQHWQTFTPRHQHSQQHRLWDCHFPLRARNSCTLPTSAGTIAGGEEGEGGGEKGSNGSGVRRAEEGVGGEEKGRIPHRDHERERGRCGTQRGLSLQPRAIGTEGQKHTVCSRKRKLLWLPRTEVLSLEETTCRYETHANTNS